MLTLAGTNHTITTPTLPDSLVLSGQITGSGGFDKLGGGEVVITGTNGNNFTGVTAVTEGQLTVRDADGLGAAGTGNETTVTAAILNIDGVTSAENVTLNTDSVLLGTGTAGLSGVLTLAGTNHTIETPTLNTDVLTLSGKITGSGGFTEDGERRSSYVGQ